MLKKKLRPRIKARIRKMGLKKKLKPRIKARVRRNKQVLSSRIDEFFHWIEGAELVELKKCNTNEDPVRPELDNVFRRSYGRKIYGVKYTVWSKKKGGGKLIVKEVFKKIKKSNHLNRLITLSPLTDMAFKFHSKNGAKLLQVNESTQNFEYKVI